MLLLLFRLLLSLFDDVEARDTFSSVDDVAVAPPCGEISLLRDLRSTLLLVFEVVRFRTRGGTGGEVAASVTRRRGGGTGGTTVAVAGGEDGVMVEEEEEEVEGEGAMGEKDDGGEAAGEVFGVVLALLFPPGRGGGGLREAIGDPILAAREDDEQVAPSVLLPASLLEAPAPTPALDVPQLPPPFEDLLLLTEAKFPSETVRCSVITVLAKSKLVAVLG